MAWTSPRTWVVGETVTAALLNTHVRDNLKAIGDAWTTYSPSWTAVTTNPTIGNGSLTGRYLQAGKLVVFSVEIVMGSTTTYGSGAYSLSLPVAARLSTSRFPFTGNLLDASAGSAVTAMWPIYGIQASATDMDLAALPVTAGNSYRVLNGTNVITLATSDRISISGVYESS